MKNKSGKSLRILLLAEESAGIQMLQALHRCGHAPIAVMASPAASNSGANVWDAARKCNYETWPAQMIKDAAFVDRLRSVNIDLIFNVHSLYVIPGAVLGCARIGAFNVHPGPLPRYAGLNAVSWALYRGEEEHGVTIHKMLPEIDTGPIVYQTLFKIEERDTALSLSAKCAREGVGLMLRLLGDAAQDAGSIPLTAQDLSKREYFRRGQAPQAGRLLWDTPANEIVNFVRACDYLPFRSPWGHPKTRLNDREVEVLKACRTNQPCQATPGTVGELLPEGALVAAQDRWVLIKKLRIGKELVKPGEILFPGARFVTESAEYPQPCQTEATAAKVVKNQQRCES